VISTIGGGDLLYTSLRHFNQIAKHLDIELHHTKFSGADKNYEKFKSEIFNKNTEETKRKIYYLASFENHCVPNIKSTITKE
jgi:hypothetical protein